MLKARKLLLPAGTPIMIGSSIKQVSAFGDDATTSKDALNKVVERLLSTTCVSQATYSVSKHISNKGLLRYQ